MLLKKVRETIRKYNLLENKDKVLIAYSGGADSTGLLLSLYELREEWSLEIFLAHFNHKLRKSADEDEQFVKRMAQEYSLPLFIDTKDVRHFARKHRMNIEEAGRELRYDFFYKTALKIDGAKIATGHTLNDQAETFLMRLIRGSGLRGLSSIFPAVEGVIIRPLIQIKHEEIEEGLKERGIGFCVDESNFNRRYLRNRIRHELLPYLQENFQPNIISQIGRIVSIFQEEEALLETATQAEVAKAIQKKDDQVSLDVKHIATLPLGLRRRLVREYIQNLKGNLRGITFDDIQSLLFLKEGKESHIKKDLVLRREKDKIVLKRTVLPPVSFDYRWNGKESLFIKEIGLEFQGEKKQISGSRTLDFDDNTKAFMDIKKLRFPLCVRTRKDGDRYQPYGSPGKKKVKEIMRAKGIPLYERDRCPIFLSDDEIIWIPGFPVSEKYKISDITKDVFVISVKS